MSSSYVEPLARLNDALDDITEITPSFRTTAEKQELLVQAAKARARLQAYELAVLAVSDDIAETTGARSTAAWLAVETRDSPGRLRAEAKLADALDTTWTVLASAFRDGAVNLAQVRVIDKALTDLPDDLAGHLVAKAEAYLVDQAAHLAPRDLAILGARVLEHLAPDIADQAEYDALLAAEDRASAATRVTLRQRGDGSTDLHARIPDLAAGLLRAYLAAFTAPRRNHHQDRPDDFAELPLERRQGLAFVALLEGVLSSQLPQHGGRATSVGVLIDHDDLVADVQAAGLAETTSGQKMTAGQARRLACNAGILAAVLGGKSTVLDLSRTARLFKPAQRRAMDIRDRGCTEVGCTMPAAFCEAHHKHPWSKGGKTDLEDGTLLCPFHHHRAHDPRWEVRYHFNGRTSFHRRQ